MIKRLSELSFLACLAFGPMGGAWASDNDYPTTVRADYVLGCMAANGQTRKALENCSCSIDVIAGIIPYEHYVQVETILSIRQGVGQTASIFRNTKAFDDMVADLRRAQAEAEVLCFK
jgi:hypothetical protein